MKFLRFAALSLLLFSSAPAQNPAFRRRTPSPPSESEGRKRGRAPQTEAAAASGRNLTITFLDIGQGDAALLETPSGKKILIDGGPGPGSWDESGWDAGEKILLPFLKKKGIKKIDVAVMSHPHWDHFGGFPALFENIPVGTLLDGGHPHPSTMYEKFLKQVYETDTKYQVVRRGDVLDWDPLLSVKVLHPTDVPWDNPNDNSIVLKITYGRISILFTGDAEGPSEEDIVSEFGGRLKAQVLKVGHHGSRTSSHEDFLSYVQPETAVISCGRNNRFRHPHGSTLSRLENAGCTIYRTDTDGNVIMTTNGKTYTAKTGEQN